MTEQAYPVTQARFVRTGGGKGASIVALVTAAMMSGCGGGIGGSSSAPVVVAPTPTSTPTPTPAASPTPASPTGATVEVWLTTPDQAALLAPQPALQLFNGGAPATAVRIDPAQRFQEIVGFGAAITDASAYLMQRVMSATQRDALLTDLFGADGQRFGFTRVTIGSSDYSRTHYSYDDQPSGQTDPTLANFSIAPAREDVLPTVRAARALNPQLAVMASPWSPPAWMKTNDSLIKGTLRADAYAPFAAYLTRTVQAFAAEGVPVDYLSIQNEPDFEPGDYPGMRLSPDQRIALIGDHVGPAFRAANLTTRILELDHNWDLSAQPIAVLSNAKAASFISGVAWHCYRGDVSAQGSVHDRFPDKDTFFTECSGGEFSPGWSSTFSYNIRTLMIGATRNWARGVLLWNMALDENHGPHLGGCNDCRGVVRINSQTGDVTRNPEYYALGHLSRFVRTGARRIASTTNDDGIQTVAFVNPDGSQVLLAFNNTQAAADVAVDSPGGAFSYRLPSYAAATFRWSAAASAAKR